MSYAKLQILISTPFSQSRWQISDVKNFIRIPIDQQITNKTII